MTDKEKDNETEKGICRNKKNVRKYLRSMCPVCGNKYESGVAHTTCLDMGRRQ